MSRGWRVGVGWIGKEVGLCVSEVLGADTVVGESRGSRPLGIVTVYPE